MALREWTREPSASAAVLDSQSVNDRVGCDDGKKVTGRKGHALVDGEGLPMRLSSTPPPFKIATGPVWCSTRSADVPVARTDLGRRRLRREAG
jgi:hypothetical protein